MNKTIYLLFFFLFSTVSHAQVTARVEFPYREYKDTYTTPMGEHGVLEQQFDKKTQNDKRWFKIQHYNTNLELVATDSLLISKDMSLYTWKSDGEICYTILRESDDSFLIVAYNTNTHKTKVVEGEYTHKGSMRSLCIENGYLVFSSTQKKIERIGIVNLKNGDTKYSDIHIDGVRDKKIFILENTIIDDEINSLVKVEDEVYLMRFGLDVSIHSNSPLTKDIDEFYAFHVDPFREVGIIETSQGGVTSSVDRFKITVKGVGSHAAIPHEGENPISVITDIANWIYSRSDRHVDAFSPRVISITRINAGNIWNVIPESGELEGTIRTLDDSVRKDIKDEFNNAVKAFASLNSVTIDIEWQEGSHVAYNDEELYEKSLKVASTLNLKTGKRDNMLIGDDFGDYAPKGSGKKSLYVLIGSGKGYTYHHPKFIANPDVLEISSKFMAELIRE